ncbi:hypothetical protein [Azospirillum sp. sgz301742]
MGVFEAMTNVVLEAGRLDRPARREHGRFWPRLRLAWVPALPAVAMLLLGKL